MARVVGKNKTKFKISKELIILVLIIIAMIVTTVCLSIPSDTHKVYEEFNDAISDYNTANSLSYGMIDEDHVYVKASLKTLDKAIRSTEDGTEEKPEYVYVLYGSLSSATILENLSKIDTEAKQRAEAQDKKSIKVYFYDSVKVDTQEDLTDTDFVADLEKDEEVLNESVQTGIEPVDLLETPAFYVYKNGKLIFNSVSVLENGNYNWSILINRAFSL